MIDCFCRTNWWCCNCNVYVCCTKSIKINFVFLLATSIVVAISFLCSYRNEPIYDPLSNKDSDMDVYTNLWLSIQTNKPTFEPVSFMTIFNFANKLTHWCKFFYWLIKYPLPFIYTYAYWLISLSYFVQTRVFSMHHLWLINNWLHEKI